MESLGCLPWDGRFYLPVFICTVVFFVLWVVVGGFAAGVFVEDPDSEFNSLSYLFSKKRTWRTRVFSFSIVFLAVVSVAAHVFVKMLRDAKPEKTAAATDLPFFVLFLVTSSCVLFVLFPLYVGDQPFCACFLCCCCGRNGAVDVDYKIEAAQEKQCSKQCRSYRLHIFGSLVALAGNPFLHAINYSMLFLMNRKASNLAMLVVACVLVGLFVVFLLLRLRDNKAVRWVRVTVEWILVLGIGVLNFALVVKKALC